MPENHNQVEEALRRSRDVATAINHLLSLSLSLENISLQEFLEKAVELILSIPWLVFKAKGAIFLLENGSLVLKAQNGLEEPVRKACARLPLGRCLCGRAALTGEVQFAETLDERHEVSYKGIEPHGHYCVPIKSPEKIYGVLNLYLHEGHRRDEKEEEFLIAFADALAGVIERKQAEEALRKSEKKFRAIFDMSQDAMYILDLEGKILTANQAACERLGYSSGEMKGKFLTDIVSPKDAALISERMEKLLATGRHIFEITCYQRWKSNPGGSKCYSN